MAENKDPKVIKDPAIPPAPAGMVTDPETGAIVPGDVLNGLQANPKGKKASSDDPSDFFKGLTSTIKTAADDDVDWDSVDWDKMDPTDAADFAVGDEAFCEDYYLNNRVYADDMYDQDRYTLGLDYQDWQREMKESKQPEDTENPEEFFKGLTSTLIEAATDEDYQHSSKYSDYIKEMTEETYGWAGSNHRYKNLPGGEMWEEHKAIYIDELKDYIKALRETQTNPKSLGGLAQEASDMMGVDMAPDEMSVELDDWIAKGEALYNELTGIPAPPEEDPSDFFKGIVSGLLQFKVAFPNMEQRPYSTRPYFVNGWLQRIKVAAVRAGGELLQRDKTATILTAGFRNVPAAQSWARGLVAEHHVPRGDIRLEEMGKTAITTFDDLPNPATPSVPLKGNLADLTDDIAPSEISPDEIVERALQHWDGGPIQRWLIDVGLFGEPSDPRFWLPEEVKKDESLLNGLAAAVLESEKLQSEGDAMPKREKDPGKLLFDPKDYVKQKKKGAVYRGLHTTRDSITIRTAVIVDTPDGPQEGVITAMEGKEIEVQLGEDEYINTDSMHVAAIKTALIPLSEFPKSALMSDQVVRLEGDTHQLRVKSNFHDSDVRTKVASVETGYTRWVEDERLMMLVRYACFSPSPDEEWLDIE